MKTLLILLVLFLIMAGCQSPDQVEESIDLTPPKVRITNPPDSAEVYGSLSIDMIATDNQSVKDVYLYLDGKVLGKKITVSPYSYQWDTGDLTDYSWHRLLAKVHDESGNSGISDTLDILVDNSIPGDEGGTTLHEPSAVGKYQVGLLWDPSDTNGFLSYRLNRNTGLFADKASLLLAAIDDPSVTTFSDTTVAPGTRYAYRVYVEREGPSEQGSNLLRVRSTPISPANLTRIELLSLNQVRLYWKQSKEPEFFNYTIRRAAGDSVNNDTPVMTELTSRSASSYTDNSLTPGNKYFYRVDVYDSHGHFGMGKSLSVVTDFPPDTVELQVQKTTKNGVTLRWSPSAASDFAGYEIHRAYTSSVTRESAQIFSIANRQTTEFQDTELQSGIAAYYRVFTIDAYDLSTGSNEVTVDIAP